MIPDDVSFPIPDAEAGLRCVALCIEGEALSEALTLLEGLHWQYPDNGKVTRELADVLLELEEPARALELLEEEIARDPLEALNYGFLGDALRALGRPRQAEIAYRSALALHPTYARAARELCDLSSHRGDLAAARAILDELIDQDPLDPFNQGYLGDLLARQGRTAGALEAFNMALWVKPDYSWAACRLAGLLCHIGRPEEARAVLERCLAVAKEEEGLLLCLAQVQHRLGLRADARRSYRRALAIDPALRPAAAGLKALLEETTHAALPRERARRGAGSARGTRAT